MSELHVRLEQLEPMRVASVRAFSPTPERDAFRALTTWAQARGLATEPPFQLFGFTHPASAAAPALSGYEFWLEVGPDVQGDALVEIKTFPGGLYAVTTCRLHGDPAGTVRDVWHKLWQWAQTGRYRWRRTHDLERLINPHAAEADQLLDLHLPVEPRPEALTAPRSATPMVSTTG